MRNWKDVIENLRSAEYSRFLLVLALAAASIALVACGDREPEGRGPVANNVGVNTGAGVTNANAAAVPAIVTAEQILQNPSAYVGRVVTVNGDVDRIFGPRAFAMEAGLTNDLLVVGRDPYPNVPDRGNTAYVVDDSATVTGIVMTLVTADVERELGWDLDSQIEAEFNARPVLIARSALIRAGRGAAGANTNMRTTNMNMNANMRGANMANMNMNANVNR